jgi:hypothetical protein
MSHAGPRLRRDWPIYLRVQILVTAAAVGLLAAWRLTAPHQLIAPIVIAAGAFVTLAASVFTRRGQSTGFAALEAWAAQPNGLFWVLPVAGAIGGAPAIAVAALANVAYTTPNFVFTHLMRRDAPLPQRHATSWIDQSGFIVLGIGLALHLVETAPKWTGTALNVTAPILAFTGAALFAGSVIHPHNMEVLRGRAATWRWLGLSGVRVVYLLGVAAITPSRSVAQVAVLSALTVPAFLPVQLAVLYGYKSGVVNAAARWGWLVLPAGLLAALLV